jgi:hypothetical protein
MNRNDGASPGIVAAGPWTTSRGSSTLLMGPSPTRSTAAKSRNLRSAAHSLLRRRPDAASSLPRR